MRFQQSYVLGRSTLSIRFGDLRDATTDVVVTSDDQQLSMGGGTSAAIREAAGETVSAEARRLAPIALGDVAVTGAGLLAGRGVRHVFHAATIPSVGAPAVDDQRAVVAGVTGEVLNRVQAMRLDSVAFPVLGTGFARFDPQSVAVGMAEVIRERLRAAPQPLLVEIWILLGNRRELEAVAFLAEFTERAQLKTSAVRSHAVLLIHGIRTAAGWRERIGNEMERADPSLTPIPIGYGYFDLFRFLMPIGPWRRAAAETSWKKMRSVFDNPNFDRVSVVAHSFGTWVLGHLLETRPELELHRIILCGAILDPEFPWDDVRARIHGGHYANALGTLVLNDCGVRDRWPIIAKSVTWGYGASGRWGFQHGIVKDRFHDLDHSGFFEEGFATAFWVPALVREQVEPGIAERISPSMGWSMLTIVKLPYVALLGLVLVLAWWLWP